MAQVSANVRQLNSVYEAFGRGDVAAVLGSFSPDIEWRSPASLPWSRGSYDGTRQVGEYFASMIDHIDRPAVVPEEFIDAGDRIVVLGRLTGTARAGRAFDAPFVHLWRFSDGRPAAMTGLVDSAAVCDAFEQTDGAPTAEGRNEELTEDPRAI